MTWQINLVLSSRRSLRQLETPLLISVMGADVKFEVQHLKQFKPATQDDVRVVIMKSPSNSCELDPLPKNLLKKVLECLLPFLSPES